MMKRLLSILLCAGLLLSCVFPVFAKETDKKEAEETKTVLTIKSVADFLEFAENCRLDSYSQDLTVSLEADISLYDTDFVDIPIFCGTFEGNGHTITELNLGGEGSYRGLFRYLTENAVVCNLAVQGNVKPTGSRSYVGGIAGSNAGKIEKCQFTGTVSGSQDVGGMAGINTVTGIIEGCKVGGVLSGSHFTGGIAGENLGVIRGCQNLAVVNSTTQQNQVELTDITLESMLNAEATNTVTDIGGIAGSSSGVIRDCTNRGHVGYQHMGYNIGGIAGSQSGYIADCENYGEILGRKEVGGIVGQMEPAALVEYEEDAVQILEKQLGAMSTTLNNAAGNVRIGAQQMEGHIYDMQDSMEQAQDALDILTPDPDDPQLPDADSIQAARNGISDSVADMTTTMWQLGETTDSVMGSLSNDLYQLQAQINAMRATLNNVSDTMGGSISDASDEDTPEDLTGKVAACVNQGKVLADLNGGGIVGAIAVENDMDPEDDWNFQGNNSLNFESVVRAVILDCENLATVQVNKQNAGGIVGWVSLGLVKSCRNSGSLEAAGAEGVGGIAGTTSGYIRESAARCVISGGSKVGGIAGSAAVVTDCHSMVQLTDVQEKFGAVLGAREEPLQEVENPVSGNWYLATQEDLGGIDGISYDGLAQPKDLEMFLAEESLTEMFKTVTVLFRDDVGRETKFQLIPGDGFPKKDIPEVPKLEGRDGRWEGLEEANLEQIYFDLTFQAVYTDEAVVIQSKGVNQSGKPVVLLEGAFSSGTQVTLEKPNVSVMLTGGQKLLDHWQYGLEGQGTVTAVRLCLPEEADKDHLKLLTMDSDGLWKQAQFHVEGSYAVIPTEATELTIAVIQTQGINWILVGGAGVLVLAMGALLLKKKKKG